MRVTIWLGLLIAALLVCAYVVARAKRKSSRDVVTLLLNLIPPLLGNVIIIVSENELVSYIGSYIYFIGLDLVVTALLVFSLNYCSIHYQKSKFQWVLLGIVVIDIVQLLLNTVTGHAFALREIAVEGAPYYSLVPYIGQTFHRIVAYGIFFASIGIFAYKTAKSQRLYKERYVVILVSMVIAGIIETFYIFSGSPVDRSMIAFGLFGLLVTYFSVFYRPVRLLDRMLARIVSGMNDAVLFFDTDGACIYGNDMANKLIGADFGEAMPPNASAMISDFIGGWNHRFNEDWTDMRRVSARGEERYINVTSTTLRDAKNRSVGASVTIRDVTQEEKNLQRERFLATHDRLTGLYNKDYFYEKVRSLVREFPEKTFLAVAIDVKDFKIINDIFSKEFGDRVLCKIAQRLEESEKEHFVCGRITGDKFGVFVAEDEYDLAVLQHALDVERQSENSMNYKVVIHAGVYRITDPYLLPSVMFDRAFMAISTIKNDFRKTVAFYDESMRQDVIWNQKISAELDDAIAEGQVRPFLQPMVDKDGKIEGAEVLVRWIHPEEGFLSPARFIPVFENNGMIARLDQHMWESACKILKDWQARGIDLFLSVNISPKDFYFIDVHKIINELVQKYGIAPEKLRLEITETVMMSDMENRLGIIDALRSEGFLVEMDDFGSGYSSLNMLKDIPVDVLKIDMMFLYKTKDTAKAQTILQTIINLSGELGIPSVTEGVETIDQLNMLVSMGCSMFQGYYFAKPMPVEDFEALVAA